MIGKLLGNRYEIIEKVGGGGMAIVYKARCRLLNRYVAVKVLRLELLEDQEFVRRFNVEAQSAASLSHPNIVSIYDVGQQDEIHYIVMEFIDGDTLKEKIQRKGTLSWKESLNVALQICSALEHAHEKRIIHRDIKPHNNIITENGMVKVTDFGIARAATSTTVTLDESTMGSVHYFSPEQARGGYTDERSDIYSLGVVMYEMLTGELPFEAESPISVALKHIQEAPKRPKSINEHIPEAIESIIIKAMHKEQNLRYASATEMLEDIYTAFRKPHEGFIEDNDYDNASTQKVPIIKRIDGSDDMAKKKKAKPTQKEGKNAVIAAVLVTLVIIGVFSYFAFNLVKDYIMPTTPEDVSVPEIVGMEFENVKNLYGDFEFVELRREYNDQHEAGRIISQDPIPGRMVRLPATIRVIVSEGTRFVTVFDVTNLDYRDAEIRLDRQGLNHVLEYEHDEHVPEGIVIRHTPGPTEEVPEGDLVTLYVSMGPEIILVPAPELVGKTEQQAKQEIRQLELVVGNIEKVESDQPKNTVISQSIPAGTEVEEKTTIDLVVSHGRKNEQTITIRLPQDRDTMQVKVVFSSVLGRHVVYDESHSKGESPLDIRLTGKGNVLVQVHIDDQIIGESTMNFGGEDE